MATAEFKAGLEEVVATTSSICFIDGQKGTLSYFGFDISDLAEHATFEETAFILWNGRLPKRGELEELSAQFRAEGDLPDEVEHLMELYPRKATPMEVLRTTVSALGHWDPDSGNTAHEASLRKAMRLTAKIPTIVAAWHQIRNGKKPIQPDPKFTLAENFLYMLSGKKPAPEFGRAFDVALTLHADHELNASTFAGRVTAATMSDMYSSVTSAIGALKGPLHGGANEQVIKMLIEIGDVAKTEAWVRDALSRKVKISGFGHRVYRTEDPRATILRRYSESLGKFTGQPKWNDMSKVVEKVVRENTKVYPNVDFYSASCYHVMGIPIDLFTPVFACSRISGWTAHIMEQWEHNRLIRPRADYTGPLEQRYVPIAER